MGDAAYSFSLTTFSRTGKLLPLEYALNAVANGRTTLGLSCPEGVVLATDKKMPTKLVDINHVHKIEPINDHNGICFAGVGPDYRVLVNRARKAAAAYESQYGEVQNVKEVTKQVASVMQEYTQRGGVRPFGVSVLVAGLQHDGTPALYQVDPSGTYFSWKATAIGKNYTSAKNFLEKRWYADMGLEDAIHTSLLTLREGFEGEMTSTSIEIGICKTNGEFQVLTHAQVQDYLDEAN